MGVVSCMVDITNQLAIIEAVEVDGAHPTKSVQIKKG